MMDTKLLALLFCLGFLPVLQGTAQTQIATDDAESYTTGFENENGGTGFAIPFTPKAIGDNPAGESFLTTNALDETQSFALDSDAGDGGSGYAVTRTLSAALGSDAEYRVDVLVRFGLQTDDGQSAGLVLSSTPTNQQTSWDDGERLFVGITGDGTWTYEAENGSQAVPGGQGSFPARRGDIYRVRADVSVQSNTFELRIENLTELTTSQLVTGTLSGSEGAGVTTLGFGNGVAASGQNLFFDNLIVTESPSGTIPVELADFDATVNGRSARLVWSTASETNNTGFAVQHASGRDAYERVGWREGAGTTTETSRYSFEIDELKAGRHRFRLKQVDNDGTSTLSEEITVRVRLDRRVVVEPVTPNPVDGTALLEFGVGEKEPVSVRLFNVLGQQVRTLYRGTVAPDQRQRVRIRTGDLASGVYVVRIQGASFQKSQRISVVN